MRVLPQQDHCDLGLIDNDNTEDMRTPPAATRGDLNNTHLNTNEESE